MSMQKTTTILSRSAVLLMCLAAPAPHASAGGVTDT